MLSLKARKARMSSEEYQKWIEKVSQGFQRGEEVELSLKHIRSVMMSTKDNVAVSTPKHLFILVNLPWQPLQRFIDTIEYTCSARLVDARIVARVIKSVPERKFTLAEATEFKLVYEYTRSYEDYIVETEDEKKVVEGAELAITEGVRRRSQEHGVLTIACNGKEFTMYREAKERVKVGETREQRVVWRVVDPEKPLGKFLARNQELLRTMPSSVYNDIIVITDDLVVHAKARRSSGIEVKVCDVQLPSEEELLECSRSYTIIVPRIYIYEYDPRMDRGRRTLVADLYYHGVKRKLVFNYAPEKLLFRCLRNRYSISSYARKVLPRGVPYLSVNMDSHDFTRYAEDLNKWARMVREEILPRVRSLRSQPIRVDPLTAFLEVFYVNTPKRKVENVVKPWIELFEKVKNLAPKATLYITFYGQVIYKRRLPNYVGYRIDKDGTVSLMSSRYIPVSGITMKGGEFERLYRETYVKKLFEYQVVPREEKLRILMEDIEEAQGMLREAGVEPATASLREFEEKLLDLAKSYEGDNVALLTLRFLETVGKPPIKGVDVDALRRMLIGLVKTGKPEDLRRFAELGGLRLIRTAVKYEMKRRGYSIKKGVMFLGSPEEVYRRILEVVKDLRGRLLALALAEDFAEALPEISVAAELERVEALLRF